MRSGSTVQLKEPTYIGCTNDFSGFQEFAGWCDSEPGYRKIDCNGKPWEIDKDLIAIGNKSYSIETCCFIPQSINKLLNCRENRRGLYPMGVSFENKAGRIRSQCRTGITSKFLGYYDDPFLAHIAWQEYKIQQINHALESVDSLPEMAIKGLVLRIDIKFKRETIYI